MIIDGVYNGGLRPLRCNEHGHALAVTGTLSSGTSVILSGMDWHGQLDSFGSAQEYVK